MSGYNQQDFESDVRAKAACIVFWYEQYELCRKALLTMNSECSVLSELDRESIVANMDYAQSRLNFYIGVNVE